MTGHQRALILFVALYALAASCRAATCSLNVQSVNFGSYDIFNTTPLDSTGNIDVACDVSTNFTLTLSSGAGTYEHRQMFYGGNSLNYNLYVSAARVQVWGDGTASTAVVSTMAPFGSFTVYGRIPAKQNVYVGGYSDNVVVTVSF